MNKINQYIIFTLIVIFSDSILLFSQNAGITTLQSYTTCPGTNVKIALNIAGSPKIASLSLRIEYDGSVLSFLSTNNSNSSLGGISGTQTPIGLETSSPRKLILSWYNGLGEGVTISSNGTGLLCNLIFRFYGGNTSLVFNNSIHLGQDCEYSDSLGNALIDTPSTYYYINGFVNQIPNPQLTEINGSSIVNIGDYETYSVENISETNYLWSAPTGWVGTSTSNSITFLIGTNSGDISVQATNLCGVSQVLSLYVTSKLGIDNNNINEFSIKNYPNPFKEFTIIEFDMPFSGNIEVNLFHLCGDYITTITNSYFSQGKHSIKFDGRNLPAGSYIYFIEFRKKIFAGSNIMNIIK